MPLVTIGFGLLLGAIGLFGYLGGDPDKRSMTALIPFFFGDLLILAGALALFAPHLRKHAMHFAAAVGLIGFILAGGRGAMKLGAAISDDPAVHRAPRMVLAMAVVCLAFVAICVWSFIQARRRRTAA